MSRRALPGEADSAAPAAEGPGPNLVLSALLLAGALAVSDGLYHPAALALVTAAAALSGLALRAVHRARDAPGRPGRRTVALLGAGLAGSLLFDALAAPGWTVNPAGLGGFRPLLGAVALLAASWLWPRPPAWLLRWRFPLLVAGWASLAALVLRASPDPGIDVWDLQQAGAAALLRGQNPYALGYPNRYGPDTYVLASEVLSADRRTILAFPYPPLTLLLDLPAYLLGDVRWISVAATALAALLVRELGGRSRVAELAGAALLLQPRTLLVVENAWTEPVALAAITGAAVVVAGQAARQARPGDGARGSGGWLALGAACGLAAAAKQYVPLLLLPLLPAAARHLRWRAAAVAVALAALPFLPFLLLDPRALWRGVIGFQLAQPFRPDAVSWPAAVLAWGGPRLPTWPAFVAAGAAVAWAMPRVRTAADALAAGAFAWLVLLLLNKQAFCNYYWLAAGLLLAAVASSSSPSAAPTRHSSTASATPSLQDQGRYPQKLE